MANRKVLTPELKQEVCTRIAEMTRARGSRVPGLSHLRESRLGHGVPGGLTFGRGRGAYHARVIVH